MNTFKKFMAVCAVAGGAIVTHSASASFVDFYFDDAGTGTPLAVDGTPVAFNRFNLEGNITATVTDSSNVVVTDNGDGTTSLSGSFDFDQTGSIDILRVGLSSSNTGGQSLPCGLSGCEFTASLSGASGVTDLSSGLSTFTTGTIEFFDVGELIASFEIDQGSVGVDSTGVPIPGGNQPSSIRATPTFFKTGYLFFDPLAEQDFADFDYVDPLSEVFKTMNLFVNLTTSDPLTFDGFPVLEGSSLSFNAAGLARFEAPVPAPATIALFGLGLLSVGVFKSRRRFGRA